MHNQTIIRYYSGSDIEMTKKKKIIIVIAAVLVVTGFFLYVLLPRIGLKLMADKYLDSFDVPCSYFAEENYSVRDDSLVNIRNKYVSIDIPADLQPNEERLDENGEPMLYQSEDNKRGIILLPPSTDKLDMTDPAYIEDFENKGVAHEKLIRGVESFGNGIPDSKYNTTKASFLLEREDYSFWDMDKAVCFIMLATFRSILVSFTEEAYIYETDDICGIVQISREIDEESGYSGYTAYFSAYSPDDLNTDYTVMIDMETLEEIYAVINSMEIIGEE